MDTVNNKTLSLLDINPNTKCVKCDGKIRSLTKKEIEKKYLLIANVGICNDCNEIHIIHRLPDDKISISLY